jgi:hypothetical protein
MISPGWDTLPNGRVSAFYRRVPKGRESVQNFLGVSRVSAVKLFTVGAFASKRKLDRLGFEFRIASGPFDDVGRYVHFDIDQLSTAGTDSVIMPRRHPVKPRRAVAKLYLRNVSGLF